MAGRPRTAVAAFGIAAVVASGLVATGATAGSSVHESVDGHGRVTYVPDGDSPFVNGRDIRLIGVQATEVGHGSNKSWCHAIAAKNALHRLVYHRSVELRSMHADSRNLGRPLRSIYVRKHGQWDNVQRELLKAGQVLWFPQTGETEHNSYYHLLAARAAAKGIGIWNTSYCGSGPYQHADLSIDLRWDANGADEQNLNGEWVRIINHGPIDVHLGGWHIRDTSLAMYTFPRHAVVPANGGAVTLHSGSGDNPNTSSARDFHWNLSHSLFGNVNRHKGEGDEAFLLDPDGDFRAWSDYPCVLNCADPLQSRVRMTVHYSQKYEWVRIRSKNTRSAIWLGDYQIRSWPYTYVIRRGTFLRPGESLIIHWGHGRHPTRLRQYANDRTPMLNDSGGRVDLSNLRDTKIVCVSWGSGSCRYNY